MTINGESSRSLPEGWRWGKLKEYLVHHKNFFTIDDDEEYQLVRVQLHGRGVLPRERLKGKQIEMKQQQRIKAGQLLVAEIDAKLGAFGLVPQELEGAIVSGHYFLYDFVSEDLRPDYLEALIVADWLTERIQQSVRGALNYAAIRPDHVLKAIIPMPVEKDIQKAVAAHMKAIRQMQQAVQRQLEALEVLPMRFLAETLNEAVPPSRLP